MQSLYQFHSHSQTLQKKLETQEHFSSQGDLKNTSVLCTARQNTLCTTKYFLKVS